MDDKVVRPADNGLKEFGSWADDDFSIEEGLTLLAAYRTISNKELRRLLRVLVSQIAKSETFSRKEEAYAKSSG